MSSQSHSWYVRGDGNQPAGPFTAEELTQSCQAGRLDANTVCWREGMSQWLPMSQVEPFASAMSASGPADSETEIAQSSAQSASMSPIAHTYGAGSKRRRASSAWIGWAIAGGIAAICALVAGVVFLLNAGTTGQSWGSSYTVDYNVVSEEASDARLKATVKGPAAKLAVILTDPQGESNTQIIGKEFMISNSQTVELPMQNPRAGTYILTVKTVEPEKVVWKKNIPLSLGTLAVVDVKFDLSPNLGPFEGYSINGIKVVLKKDGQLPVKFTDVSAALDGKAGRQIGIRSGYTMADQQHTVGIVVNFLPTAEMENRDRARGRLPCTSALFRPGERHWVKGKLVFGEDRKSLDFEKEFVAPQDKKAADAEASVPVPSPGARPSLVATPSPQEPQVSLPEPTKPEPTRGLTMEPPRRRFRSEDGSGFPRAPRVPQPRLDENPLPKGPLSGTWRATAGALFRIEDDGTTAKVKLISGHPLQVFSGELARRAGDQDAKSLSGTFDAVFQADAPKRHSIRVTATLDDSGQLHLRCADWPAWNNRGKNLGTKTLSETWTSSASGGLPIHASESGGGTGYGFGCRNKEHREAMLLAGGGNDESEAVVTGALAWLARHQMSDGSWSIGKYTTRCKDGTCTSPGTMNADSGATALGLLPFLATGETHITTGQYSTTVQRGLHWLMNHQNRDGNLAEGCPSAMYSHGVAAMALCEAYGMSNDRNVGRAAQSAINYIMAAPNKNDFGWRYKPGDPGDTSVTGWQVMALKSAQLAYLKVDPGVLEGAVRWLDLVKSGPGDSRFSYMLGTKATPAMTAVGLLCRQYLGGRRNDAVMTEGINYLMNNMPDQEPRNIYYWYYATQVLHNYNGQEWETWNRAVRDLLVRTQNRGAASCAAGSWDPEAPSKDAWGAVGGRHMLTCLSALTLEIYYRYSPLYKVEAKTSEIPQSTDLKRPAISIPRPRR